MMILEPICVYRNIPMNQIATMKQTASCATMKFPHPTILHPLCSLCECFKCVCSCLSANIMTLWSTLTLRALTSDLSVCLLTPGASAIYWHTQTWRSWWETEITDEAVRVVLGKTHKIPLEPKEPPSSPDSDVGLKVSANITPSHHIIHSIEFK